MDMLEKGITRQGAVTKTMRDGYRAMTCAPMQDRSKKDATMGSSSTMSMTKCHKEGSKRSDVGM